MFSSALGGLYYLARLVRIQSLLYYGGDAGSGHCECLREHEHIAGRRWLDWRVNYFLSYHEKLGLGIDPKRLFPRPWWPLLPRSLRFYHESALGAVIGGILVVLSVFF